MEPSDGQVSQTLTHSFKRIGKLKIGEVRVRLRTWESPHHHHTNPSSGLYQEPRNYEAATLPSAWKPTYLTLVN